MPKGFWISAGKFLILAVACLPITMNEGSLGKATASDLSSESLINCDIQHGRCTQDLAGMAVTLDILPRPVKAMKDLEFHVVLSGETKITSPYIDLSMPGMTMGPNRVELRRVRENVFEGQGVIVRCPSGRRTWKATVTLPEVGKVEFVFDVIH